MINKRPDKWGENQRLRVLFDSGCGATLVNKKFVRHWKKSRDKSTKWSTKAGSFKTNRKCKIEFTLPAFHANRNITCEAYVDESPHEDSHYDIIIGRDLLHSFGINILFDIGEISWDGAKKNMQPPSMLKGTWINEMEQEVLENPNQTPYHAKPYPVPYSQEKKLKEEIAWPCKYGVLRKTNNSEWACPIFTISKPQMVHLDL